MALTTGKPPPLICVERHRGKDASFMTRRAAEGLRELSATASVMADVVRMWRRARAEAFTPEVLASPPARTPYDLRHAAVSTWLNDGIPPAQVAEWAGHSAEILLKIYAKCLDGGAELLRQRVQAALERLTLWSSTGAGCCLLALGRSAPETSSASNRRT